MSHRLSAPAAFMVVVVATLASGCFERLNPVRHPAFDLIDDVPYSKLQVEIDYVEGFAPHNDAKSLLLQRMNERLSKPGGITTVEDSFTSSDTVYSNDDLRRLRDQVKDHDTGGDTIVFHVLYLNGQHEKTNNDQVILGVHYDHASVAIFKAGTQSGGLLGLGFSASSIERAALVHEFGHAIGLVDNGIPMQSDHEDSGHRGHSSNQESVMYWAVEDATALDLFGSSIPTQFDEDDIRDIRAAGGK